MTFLNVLTTPNPTVLLLIGGVALLLVNILYGIIRAARGNLKAGWFTVVLALVACLLVSVGAVQTASASAQSVQATGGQGGFGGNGGFRGQGGGFGGRFSGTATAQAAAGANGSNSPSSGSPVLTGGNGDQNPSQAATADTNGNPPANGTPQANGTPGRRFRGNGTPGAGGFGGGGGGNGGFGGGNGGGGSFGGNGGGFGGGNGGGGGFGGGNGGFNRNGGATLSPTAQLDQNGAVTSAIGGGVALLLGLVLYLYERRRTTFAAATSRGLLNLGAGFFIVIASLVIPIIPGQPSVPSGVAVAAANAGRANFFQNRAGVTPTPSATPKPTDTATAVPSLTEAPSETPLAMPTEIQYSSTYTVNLQKSACSATANDVLALRGDPSENQQAIGRIMPGTLIYITGRTADGKWMQVISTDGGITLQGWITAGFVTPDSACTDQTVPVVQQTGNATAAASGTAQSPSTSSAAVVPCSLLTSSAANLRPDPSIARDPIATIPQGVTLTPNGKSTNGVWWNVTYNNTSGWISAQAVLATGSCGSVPAVTLTPAP